MLKKMLATTAITTLLAMPVMAQDTTTPDDAPITDMQTDDTMDAPGSAPGIDMPQTDAPATDPMVIDPMDEPMTDDPLAGSDMPAGQALLADDIIGADLVNFEGESIATVSDAVLDAEGNPEAALVDVGGFLGFGARTVAIPVADLTLDVGDDGNPVLRTSLTTEELENLPEYTADPVETEM